MKRTDAGGALPEPIPGGPFPEPLRDLTAWLDCFTTAQGHRFSAVPATLECREYSAGNLPTLYLETSVISYLTARSSRDVHAARKQLITQHWWHNFSSQHVAFASDFVCREAERGDAHAASRRTEVLSRLPCIHETSQSHELAARIIERCRLPARAEADAHHVAVAALNGLHIVLTWNCAHLANEHMIPHMRHACEAYGYAVPRIYTPERLIEVCAYG